MKTSKTPNAPAQDRPEFIDTVQAARLASVSPRTIRNWHAAKAISALKINRVLRFHRETLLSELKRFCSATVA